MTSSLPEFALLCVVSLFTMIDPLGVIPVFTSMTASLTPAQARNVALRATFTALGILILFALAGEFIFAFFSISVNSLQVVGGLIFLHMGYEMLQARITRTQFAGESMSEFIHDIAVTPLGIPLISGPGAITTVMLLMNQSIDLTEKGILFASIAVVLAATFLVLVSGKRVLQTIGESGTKVLMRLMGLIVMVIAVEFFFRGLKPILRDILSNT